MVRLIALGKKITHRFPARYKNTYDGGVTHPKISEGKIHKVYTKAPFGSKGLKKSKPLLEVYVNDIELITLGDMIDEDARNEGFASLNAFVKYWDRVWFTKGLKFDNHHFQPVWVIYFELDEILPAGKKLIEKIDQEIKNRSR
jgi:hypothetical protein